MRDRENLSQLTQLDPDYIGFIFYPPSPRFVGNDFPVEIPGSVSKSERTGVFVNMSSDEVLDRMIKYKLDAAQLHGSESPESCEFIRDKGYKVIKAFQVDEFFNFDILKPYEQVTDYFLFDTKTIKYGGSGKKFDWSVLRNYSLQKPFFLSGGIGPDDIEEIEKIDLPSIFALDLNSKFEIIHGMKNISLLKQFIGDIRAKMI